MNPSKYEQLSEQITQKQNQEGFIKVTDSPVKTLTPKQKVILNRKANVLFNEGNIEGARRIYITTGYSDGLIRVGDIYKEQKQPYLDRINGRYEQCAISCWLGEPLV